MYCANKKIYILAFFLIFLFKSELYAKFIHLETSGEKVFFIGSVPRSFTYKYFRNKNIDNYYVAFKYQQDSANFIEFWTYGGEYCLFNDLENLYINSTVEQITFLNTEIPGGLKKPLFYHFPLGILLSIFFLFTFLSYKIILMYTPKRRLMKKYSALINNPIYNESLAIITGHMRNLYFDKKVNDPKDLGDEKKLMEDAYKLGISYLTKNGISKEDAKANLEFIASIKPIKFKRIF